MDGSGATPQPGGETPQNDDAALEGLVDDLEEADPADAPDVAEELARRLAQRMEDPGGAGGEV